MSDSIWAVIAGFVKCFNLPIDYVLYDISYANLNLYGAVIPSYRGKKEDGKSGQEEINADDPKNRDKIRQVLDSID